MIRGSHYLRRSNGANSHSPYYSSPQVSNMEHPPDFEKLITHLDEIELTTVHGRITEVVGMLIKAVVPQVKMGEVVMIKRDGEPLMAEVVGFTREEVYLSPLGEMAGI